MIINKLKLFFTLILTSQLLISCVSNEVVKVESTSIVKPIVAKEILTAREGSIKRGQGFHQSLRDLKVNRTISLKLINALRDHVEFSKLKVGDRLTTKTDSKNKLVEFSFSNSPAEEHVLKHDLITDGWIYSFKEDKTVWIKRILEGSLQGSTLQEDLVATGLKRPVVARVINVLLCKVNFRVNARMGDKYKILLNERIHNGNVIETEVLYTSYNGVRAGSSDAFFYNDGEEKSTYTAHYTEEGEALIRSGLRYPVSRLHIRSGYGKRRHPVTGRLTMHRGVDLRARSGSPVHAVARGLVVISTYNKYAGNKIAIRHADKSVSYYLHLKNRSVKKGDRVLSHQVIGRVGATGRVTGPHLHFGFKKSNGKWMNPMSKRMIATPKLKGARYSKLTEQIADTKAMLRNIEESKLSRYVLAPKSNES
jgi:murein DD-endopeptidase MepM/ murein hydrolase activator NlpD